MAGLRQGRLPYAHTFGFQPQQSSLLSAGDAALTFFKKSTCHLLYISASWVS
eukprot:m.260316 g.260316  ORF g.260316 m.260316 type:complete len:52 (-) comp19214_c0_seq2:4397-4552(-)